MSRQVKKARIQRKRGDRKPLGVAIWVGGDVVEELNLEDHEVVEASITATKDGDIIVRIGDQEGDGTRD